MKTFRFTLLAIFALVSNLLVAEAPVGCWKEISAGDAHTLAIKNDGTLWAWGRNNKSQMGDGTTVDKNTPTQIGTDTDWAIVSASGMIHSLAIKTNGTLWTWGDNSNGQLGDGTTLKRNTPVQIGSDTDWSSISGGLYFSVALKNNGTLWTWGNNDFAHLGNGTTGGTIYTPQQVGVDTDWSSISSNFDHTIALKSNGTLWAWGGNNKGQLGDGTTVDKNIPTQIGSATDWSQIAPGGYHSLAVKTDGTLYTWGLNNGGQLGDGTNSDKLVPTQVGSATDWTGVFAGGWSSFALKTDNNLYACGYGSSGQIGNGTNSNCVTFTAVNSSSNMQKVAAGTRHVGAILTDGSLLMWGYNSTGQLGDGTLVDKNVPTAIACPTSITTGIAEKSQVNALSIYPNPASDILNFAYSFTSVIIYNANGQALKSVQTPNNQLNISDLCAGAYYVKATLQNGENATHKLIIKK